MSRQTNHLSQSVTVHRRSLLIASALGGVISSANMLHQAYAADPPSADETTLARNDGGPRLVRSTNLETVRLQPVTESLSGTVIQAIAADPRGELIAVAGDDHAIRIMNAATLQELKCLQGHTDLIQTIQFDPTGNQLISAGNDGRLLFWDRNAEFRLSQEIKNAPPLACVRFSPDGNEIAAVGFNNQIYLIGKTKRSGRPQVECECTELRAAAYRSDGKMLAVAGRGTLHLFDRATNTLVGDYHIHAGRIHALEFPEESSVVVSVGEDGWVVMFDTEKKVTSKIEVRSGKLFAVCILDREHLAVAGSNNLISIVNVKLGNVVETLQGHTGSIRALAYRGSHLFSGGFDTTLCRWQLSGLQGDHDRIAERDRSVGR